jgi:hypothetical protein
MSKISASSSLLTGPSGGQLLVNFAGFVIPGYYSLEALFSVSKTDDTQWLTVCFSILRKKLRLTYSPSIGWFLLS